MKSIKLLFQISLIVLLTSYANATVNMAPIISYLLSDTTVVEKPVLESDYFITTWKTDNKLCRFLYFTKHPPTQTH